MEQISSTATNKQPSSYKITFRKIAHAAAAEVRVHKKLAIITLVLYGVAMLLFMFNTHIYQYNIANEPMNYHTEFEPSGWGIFFAVLGVLTSIFAALNVFRDTNNQQLCDVAMALPIKAVERFFSKLLCLFAIQIAPLILSVLGGNGIAILFGTIRYGKLNSETSEILFTMLFAYLAASLFIMAITVLCACCCGAPAESAYFSIIMIFIINGLPAAFVLNILNNSAGFTDSGLWIFDTNLNIDIGYWGFLFLFGDSFKYWISHAAVGCAISIAVMLLSVFIYKKRDARTVGTPISSRVFFEIMMAGGCATIFSLAAMNDGAMWGVLIAAVAYVIINIIVIRAKISFLSVLKWAGKFALTTAVFTGILIASIKTGGFGFYKARPDAVYLEGAEFSITCNKYNNYYEDAIKLYTKPLTSEQANEVMKICQKHIKNGIADINPFDIIFEHDYYSPSIIIRAESDVKFGKKPSPKFQFQFFQYIGNNTTYYTLNYAQKVTITYEESMALAEELRQLDFVHKAS